MVARDEDEISLPDEEDEAALAGGRYHAKRAKAEAEAVPRQPGEAEDGRLLLILDMNGLLVDRRRTRLAERRPDFEPKGHSRSGACFVYDRPFVRAFAAWALQRFSVAVWSSASPTNLAPLVRHVFGKSAHRLRFVWAQDKCSTEGQVPSGRLVEGEGGERKAGMKPRFLKELSRVFEAGLGGWETTLLLDDDEYKASRNRAHTALHPRAYTAEQAATDRALSEEGELRLYLEALADAAVSVPQYVASHPYPAGAAV